VATSDGLIAALGARLAPSESALTIAAVDALADGPLSSADLVARVCQAIGVSHGLAERMARAILGTRADVRQGPDGRWRRDAALGVLPVSMVPDVLDSRVADEHELRRASLDRMSFAVVDVETTGGRPESGHRVTEIAVVHVTDGVVTDVYETLVNPGRSIPPMITQLTHITDAMVRDKPRFRDVANDIVTRLDGRVFVAHNAAFDWRFVSWEVQQAIGRPLQGSTLCTVRLARKLLPHLPRRNLDSVSRHYDVEIAPEMRHRAAGDAVATAKVLLGLLRDAERRNVHTWGQLDRLLMGGTGARRRGARTALLAPVAHARDGA
jgi:DNA polymerase III subunit epsilon